MSAVLAIVLTVGVIAPVVYAADKTEYNIGGVAGDSLNEIVTNSQAVFDADTSNWQLEEYHGGGNTSGKNVSNGYAKLYTYKGDFLVYRIKTPGTGVHTVSLTYAIFHRGGEGTVYILPATTPSSEIRSKLVPDNRVGKVDFYAEDIPSRTDIEKGHEAVLGYWDFGANPAEEYFLVIECSEDSPESNFGYMYPKTFTFEAGKTKEPTSVGRAKPAVISSDAITTYEVATYSATGMINGEPHLFIPIEGKKMYVYNLETGEKYDEQDTVFTVARGITMDSDGILWLVGSQYYIQRYDPVARTLATYAYSKNYGTSAHDLIAGDNGKLYFGTSDKATVMEFDPETETFRSLGVHNTDAAYSCGLAYDPEGYIYAGLTGDKNSDGVKTNEVVKIRISDGKRMGRTDISDCVNPKEVMVRGAALVGNTYIAGGIEMDKMVAVNVDTMKQTTLYYNGTAITNVVNIGVSETYNGKHYMTLAKENCNKVSGSVKAGLYSVDAEGNVELVTTETSSAMHAGQDSVIEINGDPCVMLRSGNYFRYWNLTDKELVILEDLVSNDDGTGTTLQTMEKDDTGRIFVGAFNNSKCLIFDTKTGKLSDTFYTNGQTDTLIWYDGNLYSGNYKDGVLIRVNMEDHTKNEVLLDFRYGTDAQGNTFDQVRVHAVAAGDGKVFAGTMPDSYLRGGCIGWYDTKTGEKYIERNVVPNQSINSLYYDETTNLLYGTTTTGGGTGAGVDYTLSAKIFIYDVEAKETLRIIDLVDYLDLVGDFRLDEEGNETDKVRIPYVAGITPDPDFANNGVMWGVVAERLFTFTYNKSSNKVDIEEKFVLGDKTAANFKDSYSSGGSMPLDIEFLDGYIYVDLNGFYKINASDFTDYTCLPIRNASHYIIGDDSVLYYTNDETLYAYPLATTSADEAAAQAVASDISDIEGAADFAAAIATARASYEALTWGQKALLHNVYILEEAEADLLEAKISALDMNNLDPAEVNALMQAYEAMTATQKKYVLNYADLYTAFSNIGIYAIDNTRYAKLEDAVADASAGTVIKLLKDIEEDDVELEGGVVLDLNGCTLTADTIDAATFGNSHIIDSSSGNGLVKVQDSILLYEKNKTMPLFDRFADGYRFYDYELTLDPESEADGTSVRKFWYRFTFDNAAAYELLAYGYPGLTIGSEVYANDTRLIGVTFGAGEPLNERDFAAAWAQTMLEKPATTWLYTRISNLNKSGIVGTLGMKPWIQSCGVRAQVNAGEADMITYEILTVNPGFGPHS